MHILSFNHFQFYNSSKRLIWKVINLSLNKYTLDKHTLSKEDFFMTTRTATRTSRRTPESKRDPRRTTESRSELRNRLRNNSKQQEEKFDIKEKIMLQCIISGIIFAVVLFLNVIGNDFTDNINANLRTAINRNVTIENITSSGYWVALQDTVRSILGQGEDTEVFDPQERVIEEESGTNTESGIEVGGEMEYESELEKVEDDVPTDQNFRIHEELLSLITRVEEIGTEEKKQIVPIGLLTL